eukprot:scaffold113458_cov48-Phaeocystis_antarctica.AAC.2
MQRVRCLATGHWLWPHWPATAWAHARTVCTQAYHQPSVCAVAPAEGGAARREPPTAVRRSTLPQPATPNNSHAQHARTWGERLRRRAAPIRPTLSRPARPSQRTSRPPLPRSQRDLRPPPWKRRARRQGRRQGRRRARRRARRARRAAPEARGAAAARRSESTRSGGRSSARRTRCTPSRPLSETNAAPAAQRPPPPPPPLRLTRRCRIRSVCACARLLCRATRLPR